MPLKLCEPGERAKSPYWYVRGSVAGQRIEESTGETRKDRAQTYLDTRTIQLRNRALHGQGAGRTYGEATLSFIETCKPKPRDEKRCLAVSAELGDQTPLDRIDAAAIARIIPKLSRAGAKGATINRNILSMVSVVLHHAHDLGWVAYQKISRRRTPKGKLRFMTEAEAVRLMAAAGDHLKPILEFMLGTGARIGETLDLDWDDVDLNRGHCLLRDTKNGDDRGIPLNTRVVAAMANLPGANLRQGKVFRRPDGKPYAEKDEEGGQIKTAFLGACRRAGIGHWAKAKRLQRTKRKDILRQKVWTKVWKSDVTPHTCRHTWATWFYGRTRDVRALMELGGWKEISQVQIYVHANKEHLRDDVELMADWGKPGGQPAGADKKTNAAS